MPKNLTSVFLITCLLFFGCSKARVSDVSPKIISAPDVKIQLVSEGGQTDTIGKPLLNPIIVKVTENGTPVSGYSVQFVASGCNQTDTISTLSQPDGTAVYDWSLAADVGQQGLKAYVLNSNNKKVDSVTATATGLQSGSGWHNSACSLQDGQPVSAFCKLSTGRLFTCYNGGKTYLRYSDDNGVSWSAVKSLGSSHTITGVFSTPSDELFVLTVGNDGTFYSKDAGQTWSNLGVPPFNTALIYSAICTSDGKLMVTSVQPPLCISLDKGKTWASVPFSAFVPQNMNNPTYANPTEDKDGNLYVVEKQNENIFKSADGGNTWDLVPETGILYPGTDCSFYIDDNNWFYKSTTRLQPGIYISKDKGVTYNLLLSYSVVSNADDMSVQSDGNFYYEDTTGPGLYSYNYASSATKQIFAFGTTESQPYIVAKNNNIIVANLGKNYIKYYTK